MVEVTRSVIFMSINLPDFVRRTKNTKRITLEESADLGLEPSEKIASGMPPPRARHAPIINVRLKPT